MLRRLAVLLVASLLLTACSSDGKDAGSTTTTSAPSKSAYEAAVIAGLVASTPKADRAKLEGDLRCVGKALVESIGVDRFTAAGVTLAQLRDPAYEASPKVADSMSQSARVALGARLQACDIGRIVGSQTALDLAKVDAPDAKIDPADARCFGNGFKGDDAREMVGELTLSDLSAVNAERIARLTVKCFDMSSVIAATGGVELSAPESRCVAAAARNDRGYIESLAAEYQGVEAPDSSVAQFGIALLGCLTPEHRQQFVANASRGA